MKYPNDQSVQAVYGERKGNPFLEALPEFLGKAEFMTAIGCGNPRPVAAELHSTQERRSQLSCLSAWFHPMDYMYHIYDILYRAMESTYQSQSTVEAVRQLNQLYMDFRSGRERTLAFATQSYCGAILGVPGIGKTSTIRRCLNLMPQVVVHTKYEEKEFFTKQINYLVVECPADCSIKALVFNILSAIDKALESDYFRQVSMSKNMAASVLTSKLKIICMNHHIGLIVIDEIQHAISTAVRNRQTKPLIRFLVELTNETATSVCFVGTLEAEDLFLSQEHLKRRTRGLRLLPLKFDASYRRFLTELWEYQLTLKHVELTEKMMKQIYDLSGGIPAYIVKLFQEAQIQAILSGTERLNYDNLKMATERLGIEVPRYFGNGTSISEFQVQNLEGEVTLSAESDKTKAELRKKSGTGRFYATKRGRPQVERNQTDLVAWFEQGLSTAAILGELEKFHMLERRCV